VARAADLDRAFTKPTWRPLKRLKRIADSEALIAQIDEAHADACAAVRAYSGLAARYTALYDRYEREATASRPVLAAKERVAVTHAAVDVVYTNLGTALAELAAAIEDVGFDASRCREWTRESMDVVVDDLDHRVRRAKEAHDRRYNLLQEWRSYLEQRQQVLYSILVRTVDVVGATCIGISTCRYFQDVDFDVVIADEAGQIQVYDLLVPLVRGKAAILVGDHKQLPPYVNDEARAVIGENYGEDSLRLMDRSLFEDLFVSAEKAGHVVRLDEQFRMPECVADFVSVEFCHYSAPRSCGSWF